MRVWAPTATTRATGPLPTRSTQSSSSSTPRQTQQLYRLRLPRSAQTPLVCRPCVHPLLPSRRRGWRVRSKSPTEAVRPARSGMRVWAPTATTRATGPLHPRSTPGSSSSTPRLTQQFYRQRLPRSALPLAYRPCARPLLRSRWRGWRVRLKSPTEAVRLARSGTRVWAPTATTRATGPLSPRSTPSSSSSTPRQTQQLYRPRLPRVAQTPLACRSYARPLLPSRRRWRKVNAKSPTEAVRPARSGTQVWAPTATTRATGPLSPFWRALRQRVLYQRRRKMPTKSPTEAVGAARSGTRAWALTATTRATRPQTQVGRSSGLRRWRRRKWGR
ncbi:hypothetical protein T492DRAFT_443177 [Pavlovales sp. CCMP2436]|nr:hypothetical protein T492DRAFT_443177 [Pavlovales sp. CCMP2436]